MERLEDRTLMAYDLGFAFALGSTGIENANAVATDTSGNVVVAGPYSSASIDLDPGPGEYILSNAGGYDGYVAKYDPAGNLAWGVQVGATDLASVYKVAVDGAGNVLIMGIFRGSIEISAPGRSAVTLTNGGTNEGFLAKLDPAGNALWASTFGAAANPRLAYGMTADAAGNVYASGYEGNRLFVAKYSASGAAVWTQVISGATGTVAYGERVDVDTSGNVVVVGEYRGKIDFNPDPLKTNFLTSNNNTLDVCVLKLNASGAYVWAGSMGGPSDDGALAVAVDGAGNVLVSGSYGFDTKKSKNDFDPGQGTLSLPGSGGSFLVKLDPNRNLIWGRSVAAFSFRDITLDALGNVYTTGAFNGTIDADPGPGTFNLTAGGTGDVYVSKLDSNGSFVWATDILKGGPGSNGQSFGIAVDGSGNVFTTGFFRGTDDFDPRAGTYSLTATPDGNANTFSDAFVSKLVPSSTATSTATATDVALMLLLAEDLTPLTRRK